MARVENFRINQLTVVPIKNERTYDHPTIDQCLRETYITKGYDKKPKSREEALAIGEKYFNDLVSSVPVIAPYLDANKNAHVVVHIIPTRYMLGEAMIDLVAERDLEREVIERISPNLAGVSIVAPTKYEGEKVIVGQIKGKATGSGQISAAIAAGHVNGEYVLNVQDPLTMTLRNEVSEELGLDLSILKPGNFIHLINEKEFGRVNFACLALNVELEILLESFLKFVEHKPPKELEVTGLALIPLENPESIRGGLRLFDLVKEGKTSWHTEKRGLRPYTEAWLEYLADKDNLKFLLEQAGF